VIYIFQHIYTFIFSTCPVINTLYASTQIAIITCVILLVGGVSVQGSGGGGAGRK
jgi:hypothetical protein